MNILAKTKSIVSDTCYFVVGVTVITGNYAYNKAKPVIDAGKRQMCREPLHMHHDGCPVCDIHIT